jgi:poly(A) polymerase
MQQLGVGPGPEVGHALAFLLELKRREGDLPRDELSRRLDAWWADHPSRRSSG